MHLSLNIVMVFVTLMVVIPFAWFILAEKSTKLKKKRIFENIANTHKLEFTTKEYWNDTFIGFDEHKNTLLYINLKEHEPEVQKIKLDDVKKCVLNRTSKEYKNEGKFYSELSSLDLDFTFASNTAPERISFYKMEDNFTQNQEVIRAEKWLALIENHKINKLKNAAA